MSKPRYPKIAVFNTFCNRVNPKKVMQRDDGDVSDDGGYWWEPLGKSMFLTEQEAIDHLRTVATNDVADAKKKLKNAERRLAKLLERYPATTPDPRPAPQTP